MPERPAASSHLGLDLGGTYIKWVVAEQRDGEWHVLDRGRVETPVGPNAVVHGLSDVGRDALTKWPHVSTVGVGVPGPYDPATGATRMLPNLPGEWSGVPVAARVSDALGLPVHLINDARAFGLAELRLGAGRGADTMVGLTLGTGVGGVVAVNGQVHQGHDGTAGELGHQVIEPDGPPCTCGGQGCLEALTKADRIEEAAGTATVKDAATRARAGDERALSAFRAVGRYLAIGIGNVIVVLTPDRVVIGGGISAAGDLLVEPIREELRRRVFITSLDEVEIVIAELGTWAGAIGAAVHGAESVS